MSFRTWLGRRVARTGGSSILLMLWAMTLIIQTLPSPVVEDGELPMPVSVMPHEVPTMVTESRVARDIPLEPEIQALQKVVEEPSAPAPAPAETETLQQVEQPPAPVVAAALPPPEVNEPPPPPAPPLVNEPTLAAPSAVLDPSLTLPPANSRPADSADHSPFSCFTDRSSPEQREFDPQEQALFRHVFDWPEKPTSSCKRMIKLGGIPGGQGCLVDGDKYACLDEPLQLGTAKDCLVYSFGINYDWSFDEASELFGCEVHSFDPSIEYPEGKRSPGITFHHIGIGRNRHTNVYGWQIYTLDQIMTMLGHENRTIHYMKMDAEGGEFDMMAQQLFDTSGKFVLDKVEQIGFEVHYRLDPRLEMNFYRTVNTTVTYMKQLGFNVVQWEYNKVVWQRYVFPGVERPVSLLYEILLVKNGPDTWDKDPRGPRRMP